MLAGHFDHLRWVCHARDQSHHKIAPTEDGRVVISYSAGDTTSLGIADAVRISQVGIEGPLGERIDGYLHFICGYSDSTQIPQLSLGAGISRRNR